MSRRKLHRPLAVGVVTAAVSIAIAVAAAGCSAPEARAQRLGAGTSSSSAPDPKPTARPPTDLSPAELHQRQLPLIDAANQIRSLVHRQKLPGFAGLNISPEAGTVTLYWKGDQPEPLTDLLKAFDSTVPVDVVSATYTEDELQAEIERILRDPVALVGTTVTVAAPRPDGSGIELSVASGRSLDAVPRVTDTGIPITWSTADPVSSAG